MVKHPKFCNSREPLLSLMERGKERGWLQEFVLSVISESCGHGEKGQLLPNHSAVGSSVPSLSPPAPQSSAGVLHWLKPTGSQRACGL